MAIEIVDLPIKHGDFPWLPWFTDYWINQWSMESMINYLIAKWPIINDQWIPMAHQIRGSLYLDGPWDSLTG